MTNTSFYKTPYIICNLILFKYSGFFNVFYDFLTKMNKTIKTDYFVFIENFLNDFTLK